MSPKLVSLPVRIGLRVTRTTLKLSVKLAGAAAGVVVHRVESQFSSPQPAASAPESDEPAPAGSAEPSPAPAPEDRSVLVEEDVVAPDEQPQTPLTPHDAAVKTIDDEDEVVAEFAEPGAEDGAGAQLHLEEPWEGYDCETADAVNERIANADVAELAFLELYEQSHKQRKTVLHAAAQRLQELSPSNAD